MLLFISEGRCSWSTRPISKLFLRESYFLFSFCVQVLCPRMSRKSILYVARKCFPKFSMAQEKYLNGKRWKQYSFTQLFIEFYDTLTTTLVLSSIFFFRTGIKGWSEPMAPEWYAESERSEASVMHTTNDDKIHISVKIPRRIRLGTTTCSAWVLPEFPRVATAQQYTYSQMLGERGGGGGLSVSLWRSTQ